MIDLLANIVVYLFLGVILGAGVIGTIYGWRDDRARRGEDDARRPDSGAGADPE